MNKLKGLGIHIKTNEAYQQHKQMLPRWRRILWPRLTKHEKQKAILNAVLAQKANVN